MSIRQEEGAEEPKDRAFAALQEEEHMMKTEILHFKKQMQELRKEHQQVKNVHTTNFSIFTALLQQALSSPPLRWKTWPHFTAASFLVVLLDCWYCYIYTTTIHAVRRAHTRRRFTVSQCAQPTMY